MYAICHLSIVPLRDEASHKSEQISQLLYEQVWLLGNKIPIGEVNEFIFIDCGQTAILDHVIKV